MERTPLLVSVEGHTHGIDVAQLDTNRVIDDDTRIDTLAAAARKVSIHTDDTVIDLDDADAQTIQDIVPNRTDYARVVIHMQSGSGHNHTMTAYDAPQKAQDMAERRNNA